MISNACATMRTARSFLPLLRPFIIKLDASRSVNFVFRLGTNAHGQHGCLPVDQSLNDGHLGLLELLLGITASGVGEVDGVADLDVVGERDVLDFDTSNTRTDNMHHTSVNT